jgi:hypothetical protein
VTAHRTGLCNPVQSVRPTVSERTLTVLLSLSNWLQSTDGGCVANSNFENFRNRKMESGGGCPRRTGKGKEGAFREVQGKNGEERETRGEIGKLGIGELN